MCIEANFKKGEQVVSLREGAGFYGDSARFEYIVSTHGKKERGYKNIKVALKRFNALVDELLRDAN